MSVLIYGATGRTGSLIARELTAAGVSVVVAGRNPSRLRTLAAEIDCSARVAALDELATIITDEVTVLVNVAGPFEDTVPLAAQAAANAGIHYVDLSNELAAITALQQFTEQFTEIGRSAIPAAGFGTVATDLLAKHLVDATDLTVRLELGMQIDGDGRSAGAARSSALVLANGGTQLIAGQLVHFRLGTRAVVHPSAPGLSFVPLALGDLAVTPLTTGVQTVSVGVGLPMPGWLAQVALPLAAITGSLRTPPGREPTGERAHTSQAWAQAFRGDGSSEWAHLATGEGYEFSARAAAITVIGLLAGGATPGVVTAVGQFGDKLRAHLGVDIQSSLGGIHVAAK